jgi:DNA mismatch repair protein MutS2
MSPSSSSYLELDLHRLTADEAIIELEAFLYEAYCAGVPAVRVVHGKGTGMLRGTVRSWLPKRSLVKSFRPGWTWEGGDGVTIVELAD